MEKPERVQKIISNAGYCSRRKAEELIKKGKVLVNGKQIKLGDKAVAGKDKILIEGKPLKYERHLYFMFYKPCGVLTTLKDPHTEKTITRFINIKQRVYPVGRLDQDSEGLLILTNDGDFANRIMHPRYEIKKTYFVSAEKSLSEEDIKKLEEGIEIDKKKTSKAFVKKLSDKEFEITIHEGRKHIIRKMLEALDNKVLKLVRVRIGKLNLGSLKPGRVRKLTKKEIEMIFE